MKDKYSNDNHNAAMIDALQSGEYRDGSKFPLSRYDFELYDESKAVPGNVVRIKRMGSVAKNEKWRIIENDELKFIVEGEKLSKKECAFLRTVPGVNFLIAEYKVGFKSLSELRARLKQKL
jgi:hypothetical protein